MTTEKNRSKPAMSLRQGSIKASVWNHGNAEKPRYSVRIERSYKNEKTGTWETVNYFSGPELLVAARLLEQAFLVTSVDADYGKFGVKG